MNTISLADPAKPIIVTPDKYQIPAGTIIGLGLPNVTNQILKGNDERLGKYRSAASVLKFRTADIALLTANDLIRVSHVCLAATESAEGHAVDPDSVIVVPPNHFAVISRFSGFRNLPDSN